MKFSSKERSLQWISNQYNRGNISFEHKLQRPIGQWNPKLKSYLIHSLLAGYPINPIYIVEEGGILYPLDGSQRVSISLDYIFNKFSLHAQTPSISLDVIENGERRQEVFEIAGKKFKKQAKEVQEAILASSLTFCLLSDYTEEEVREMFRRQNSGKPLTGKLLRVTYQSDDFSNIVYNLSNHKFMEKLVTKTNRKNGTDRDLIIQSFMLILTNQKEQYLSFKNKDIDVFIESKQMECIEKSEYLESALNKLNEHFEEIKIPLTSIPMLLYSAYRVNRDKKSFEKYTDIVIDFLENYDNNEEYKKYVLSGTSARDNVQGRYEYWKKMIKDI